jgi:hypothetical protein
MAQVALQSPTELVEAFLLSKKYGGLSSNTIETYQQELRSSHDLCPLGRFHGDVGGWLLASECCEMQATFDLTHRV